MRHHGIADFKHAEVDLRLLEEICAPGSFGLVPVEPFRLLAVWARGPQSRFVCGLEEVHTVVYYDFVIGEKRYIMPEGHVFVTGHNG